MQAAAKKAGPGNAELEMRAQAHAGRRAREPRWPTELGDQIRQMKKEKDVGEAIDLECFRRLCATCCVSIRSRATPFNIPTVLLDKLQ